MNERFVRISHTNFSLNSDNKPVRHGFYVGQMMHPIFIKKLNYYKSSHRINTNKIFVIVAYFICLHYSFVDDMRNNLNTKW